MVAGTNTKFDLLMNAGEEFLIVFEAVLDSLDEPRFVYDGKNTAVFYKNKHAPGLIFTPIPKEAQAPLKRVQQILCVEMQNEKIVNEYYAKVEEKTF